MGHATSDENLKPTKDGRKRVSSQSTLTTDLVIFPNLKKAKISDEEDHDNSPSKEKLALKDSTDTDQTSALDAVGNAMKIEQDAIHELAGIGSHTRGSTRQDDKAFNPALVLKENWAYYTQKKGTEKAFQEDTFLFAPLANTWQMLEELKHSGTGSKKKAIAVLTNFFRLVLYHCPHEIPYAAFLCFHRVAPDYFGVEVGVGESILIKTICETYGRKEKLVKTELEEKGDLGEVAQASRSNMSMLVAPQRLTMRGVLNEIRAVAETKGANAQLRKRDRIKKLLISAVKNEPKFIIRFLEKNLRTGVKSAIVLSSLAFAFVLSPPEKSELLPRIKYMLLKFEIDSEFIECVSKIKVCPDIRRVNKSKAGAMLELKMQQMEQAVRQAYSQVPNIAYVVYHLLCGLSAEELREQCVICPGVPVSPMLAKPTKGLGEILDAMDGLQFIAEYKYDGERIQIHKCNDGDVRLFSRNMEVLDHKYPDVKEMAKEAIQDNTDDFIIDAEVVAFDEENGEILPFQTLSGRKRKDVNLSNVKIQVHLFVFDCLRHNGEILVATSLCNRKSHLLQAVKEIPNKLSYAKGATITDTYELENLLNDAIEAKTEGLIVKVKDGERSYYEPSKRSINWLKLKKDYLDNLGDSVDLVPVGAFWGRGRRSGAYGAYLLAVYDPDDEVYRTVCKVATGFSDENLSKSFEYYNDKTLTTRPPYYHVSKRLTPDVWVEACQVWECKAADLSISPVHTAAFDKAAPDKGIGLRFPRFLRVREDKKPHQATDSSQILHMFEMQFKAGKPPAVEEEEDFLI